MQQKEQFMENCKVNTVRIWEFTD